MSGDASKGVSLCIPRVFANISWYRIKQVFIALNWGYVDRVDVIPSGGTKRAFVHFAPGRFTETKVLEALCEHGKLAASQVGVLRFRHGVEAELEAPPRRRSW